MEYQQRNAANQESSIPRETTEQDLENRNISTPIGMANQNPLVKSKTNIMDDDDKQRMPYTSAMPPTDGMKMKPMVRRKDGGRQAALTSKPIRAHSMQRLANTGDPANT